MEFEKFKTKIKNGKVINNNVLFNNDSLDIMQKMIDNNIKVNSIITDPPYNISRKNNFHTLKSGKGDLKYRQGIDFGEWDKKFDLYNWIDLGIELLDKNGSMVIFNDWKNIGNIARYAESQNMLIKDMIRFEKTNPMPRNIDRRYVTDFEVAVWLVKKGAKWVFNRQDEKYQRCKFSGAIISKSEKVDGGHPTQKPLWLMEEIIKIHTNEDDIVLDPFSGSFTTGVACNNLNRKFIGMELEEKYFNIGLKRLSKSGLVK